MHIKKNTMAKVVNQNDLKDVINSSINIIKSSVMFASDVANIVSALPSIDENNIKKIQNVSNNIKSIVNCLDVSKIILNILNEYGNRRIFDPLLKLKMKLVIKRSINAIDILIQEIGKSLDILSDDIIEKMDKLKKSETFKNLTNLFDVYKLISDVKLSSVYDPKMLIKQRLMIRRMMRILSHIVQSVKGVLENPQNKIDDNLIKKVNVIIETIDKIKSIDKIKIGLFIIIKLKRLKKAIKTIHDIVIECSNIDLKRLKSADQKISLIQAIINGLAKIFIKAILISPLTLLVPVALFSISISLLSLKLLIWVINSIISVKSSIKIKLKIISISGILTSLAGLFILSILIAPVAIVASLAMLIIIGSLYLMYLGIKLISLIARSILKGKTILGLLALLIVFSILTVIATMMGIIALISIVVAENAMNILILMGIIAAVVLSVGIFAFVLGLIIVPLLIPITIGLVSMVFIVGMITLIAIMLLLLSKIELDPDKIKKNVKSVISTALMVVDCIFGGEDEDSEESDKSWIVSVIEKFASGLVYIIKAIMAVAFLATIIVAILLITLIAAQLRLLQELDLDPNKIKTNVHIVIDTAMMITDILFGPDNAENEESDKSWIVSVIETFASGLVSIIKAIMAISFLATTLLCITLIMIIAKQLEYIQQLQLDPDKIRTNIQNIFDICNMIKNQLFSNPPENKGEEDSSIGSIIGKFFKPMADIANALSMFKFLAISLLAIGGFATLAKHLQTINEFKGVQNADQKVAVIKSLCSQIIQGISEKPNGYKYGDAEDKIDLISDLLEAIYDYGRMSATDVENTTKITDSYIKFFDKINSVDLVKLKTTVKLFEKMAEFSESINGDFEELAESLNEKIAPLLEELNKGMEKVGEKVEKSGADMSASISANSNSNMTPSTMEAQVKRENPSMTPEDIKKTVDQRMADQARQQSSGLESKIDELIELFRTGQARVVMR